MTAALLSRDALAGVSRSIEARLSGPDAMTEQRFEAFLAHQRALGLVQGERPLCRHLSPFVISRERYGELSVAAERVVSALEKLARRALHDDVLASLLGLTPLERELAETDPGYPGLLTVGRLDALFHDGRFAFIEMNADSPGGILDQMLVEQTLFELPHLDDLQGHPGVATPRPHEGVLRALLDAYAATERPRQVPTMALVDFESTGTLGEIEALARAVTAAGCPSFYADPRELDYDGVRLRARGREIDLVYRRVLVNDLLGACGKDHPLIRAYRDGAVSVANSFRTKALNKKAAFAFLTDPKYAAEFTDEERAAIHAHVPWTRRIAKGEVEYEGERVDLGDLLRTERRRLVLKPNDEYGGQGVVLGWLADDETWEAALVAAETTPMIVQERIDAATARMPAFHAGKVVWEDVYFDVCPFVFGGRMEGGIVRLSPTEITNVSAGAGVSSLLVVGGAERA